MKFEASSFTGRDPDENRYDFDKPRFDSWSGRLSYNPSSKWALQVSHGFIKQPESLHSDENVIRTTASATYSTKRSEDVFTNFTAVWDLNKTKGHRGENATLLEGSHSVRKTTVYGRYEWIQKSIKELNLENAWYGHDNLFSVHAISAGVSYDFLNIGQTKTALGAQLTLYKLATPLYSLYGKMPLAGEVYVRIYPKIMSRR